MFVEEIGKEFEIENGLSGMKRNIFIRLCMLMRFHDQKIKAVVGICHEHFVWKCHSSFIRSRITSVIHFFIPPLRVLLMHEENTDVGHDYTLLGFLGEGKCGDVYKCGKHGKEYAIKKLRKINCDFSDDPVLKLNSRFLVKIIETFKSRKGEQFIVTELYLKDSFRSVLTYPFEKHGADLLMAIRIAIQLMLGLEVLHRAGITHGGFVPENIFLDRKGNIRISDAAMWRYSKEPDYSHSQNDRFMYVAPENYSAADPLSPISDLWCLGLLLYELFTNKKPFDGRSPMLYIMNILNNRVTPIQPSPTHCPHDIAEIIHALLNKDPLGRPTAREILQKASIRNYGKKVGLLDYFPPPS